MKNIFYIYCVWYISTALAMTYCTFNDVMSAKVLASFSVLGIGFVCIAPLLIIINPDLIMPGKSDSKYMNFCLTAGGLRILFWSVSILGFRDHMILLYLNAFGMAVFALLESRFKRISNEYFKY